MGTLRGPLSSTNGLRSDSRDDLHQLVHDLASYLGRAPERPDAYGRALEAVLDHSAPDLVAIFEAAVKDPPPAVSAGGTFDDAERVLRAHCEAEHGDDYGLLDFCLTQQRRAVEELKRGAPPGVPPDVFGRIRERAARDYPSDYAMRRFAEKQEADAYLRTRP